MNISQGKLKMTLKAVILIDLTLMSMKTKTSILLTHRPLESL